MTYTSPHVSLLFKVPSARIRGMSHFHRQPPLHTFVVTLHPAPPARPPPPASDQPDTGAAMRSRHTFLCLHLFPLPLCQSLPFRVPLSLFSSSALKALASAPTPTIRVGLMSRGTCCLRPLLLLLLCITGTDLRPSCPQMILADLYRR